MTAADRKNEVVDYTDRYFDTTTETLLTMYAKRDTKTGDTTEGLNEIIRRVSKAVAIAELKYQLKPEQIIALTVEEALQHPEVMKWAKIFEDKIGRQVFWANTPANINADPETSLMVLKFWAHATLADYEEDEIWKLTEAARHFEYDPSDTVAADHFNAMKTLSEALHGKGCLAACGVAYLEDTLEGIQNAARMEAIATKASMGMGLNTSSLRPWASVTSNGAAASGPDRFYEKTISNAVLAVAQGGRRGGALIELRNSDHPDLLFFIDKKKIGPQPDFAKIFSELAAVNPKDSKSELLKKTIEVFGNKMHVWKNQQTYLKNTNITVLAMPGFMEAVRDKKFYRCSFKNQSWVKPIYDPRRPKLNEEGKHLKNKLTKELLYEEYSVSTKEYPGALDAARSFGGDIAVADNRVTVRGCFYAPEVMDRIVQGMRDSGEPGMMFYELINASNANSHAYDLNTCNPCGEQTLPAGLGKDGNMYMGVCNLSSMHAAHPDFWKSDGSFDFDELKEAVTVQQRFMDNVTDISWFPLPEQNWTARIERRNGGGFAGIAEHLSRRNLRFGTVEACEAVAGLYEAYSRASVIASIGLAAERGTYPLWKGSKWELAGRKVRNACMVNNAPTGTLAQAMQTSWGIEPHVGIVFGRDVRTENVRFIAPGFEDAMEKVGLWPDDPEQQQEAKKKIYENGKSIANLKGIPQEIQHVFPIKKEITPQEYVSHLVAVYAGCNWCPESMNAVSNTCAIPEGFDPQTILKAVQFAWENGVKALTFYPDGSRDSQPCEVIDKVETKSADLLDLLGYKAPRTVSIDQTTGATWKVKCASSHGPATLHLTLNHEINRPGELIEVYARVGKNGDAGPFEAIGRLCSAFLQYAAQFGEDERRKAEDTIIKQLIDIQSGHTMYNMFPGEEKSEEIHSACDGIAKAMMRYQKKYAKLSREEAVEELKKIEKSVTSVKDKPLFEAKNKCQQCRSELQKVDGCWGCIDCGWSKC